MHGCGWDSGAARERSSALWLPQRRLALYALGADGVGATRPGARGSRVTASRYALGAEGGGAARPGAYMCTPRTAHVVSWGGSGDVEDVVRRALLARFGARHASNSCRGRGWGSTPRELQCRRLRHARAERRYGGSWQEGGARAAAPPLQGLRPPARRPCAAGAHLRAQPHSMAAAGTTNNLWCWAVVVALAPITSGRLSLIGGSTGSK